MTPKEKAVELVNKYVSLTDGWVYGISSWEYKKKCALIAVDEILEEFDHFPFNDDEYLTNNRQYWQQVKQEIEKL
jgi:hypothetical protein